MEEEHPQATWDSRLGKLSTIIGGCIGTWIIAAPFILGPIEESSRGDVLLGALIVVTSGFNHQRIRMQMPIHPGAAGFTLVIGVWLIIGSVVSNLPPLSFWNSTMSGVIIIGIAAYQLYTHSTSGR